MKIDRLREVAKYEAQMKYQGNYWWAAQEERRDKGDCVTV